MGKPKKLGGVEQGALPPKPPDCPDCRVPLRQPDCFCASCRSYWSYQTLRRDLNKWERIWGAEPNRGCELCGKYVDVDGFCESCDEYRAPRLHIQGYSNRTNSWVLYRYQEDPRGTDRKCTKEENIAHLRALRKMLAATRTPMGRVTLAALDTVPF